MAIVKLFMGRSDNALSILIMVIAIALMITGLDLRHIKRPNHQIRLIYIYSLITLTLSYFWACPHIFQKTA